MSVRVGRGLQGLGPPVLRALPYPLKELGKDVEFELQLLQGLSGLRLGQ